MFCAVTVSDYSAVLYTWKLLREYISNVHNNKNKSGNCVRWRKRQLTLLWQSFCNIYVYQIMTLYTLNLHNVICQLHLNKPGWWSVSQSVSQFSCSVVSNSLRPHESQPARPPCPSPIPRVHSDSCPLNQWCHPAISSSVVPFFSCPRSLPASESFPMSQLFTSGGQSTGVSALASFLPKKSQGWSPLGWTGWISLQSKGFSRVFSSTTVQKHQFFGAQLSSQSNSHIHTWLLEKP